MAFVEGENTPTVQHNNLKKAEKEAQRLADKYGKKVFVLESTSLITPDEINIKIDTFEKALEYLGRENNACMSGIPDKHAKALNALNKLFTIAEAWNKADNFVPDYDNTNQYKWFPWFQKQGAAGYGFAYAGTAYTASTAAAGFGSRLCFSTSERAEQFGKQFIDLWNDFLLLNA